MYKRCTTEKGSYQQKRFEQTLLFMMQRIPYDEISVRKLCEETGISRKTFYRLFTDKESVLCALIDQTYTDFDKFDVSDSDLVPDISRELQVFFLYWKQQQPLLDVLYASHKTGLLIERSLEHILRDDFSTIHRLGADQTENGREIILFHIGGIMTLVLDWYRSGYSKSIPELTEILHSLLTHPPIRFPYPTDNI